MSKVPGGDIMVRVPSILLLAVVIPAVARSGKAADPRPGEDPLSARTFYLSIPLGVPAVDDPATGVYLPEKYTAGDTIDLVLFLRGYDVKRPKSATAVREYWGSSKHPVLKSFLFREEIDRSGKNVVLVVPPLGPFSEAGKLVQAGGVQAFLDGVVAGLAKHGPFVGRKHPPKVRHLILAAHSGGGVPLRRLAQELGRDDRFRDKLTACWGFDSIYGVRDKDAEFWADWAKDHPKTQIRMYYLFTQRAVGKDPKRPVGADNPVDHREPSGTSGPALDLERLAKARSLANVAVVRDTKATTLDHNEVPRTHLSDLLKLTTCLDTR